MDSPIITVIIIFMAIKDRNHPRFPSREKNLENMKLLLTHKPVIEIIEETREHLDIPENGFELPNQKEDFIKWDNNMLVECDRIIDSKEFISKESAIRKKRAEKQITRKEARKLSYELYLALPVNFLKHQINRIIIEFNVPENYEFYLRQYILHGIIEAPPTNFSVGPVMIEDGHKVDKINKVHVTIYNKLTDDDLRDLKYEINNCWGRRILPTVSKLKDDDLDSKLSIESNYNNRTVMDMYEYKSYKLTASEVAENEFDDESKKGLIYTIVHGLNKLRHSRFGK